MINEPGTKIEQRGIDMEDNYFSKTVTDGMKGYLCICILIHHIQQFSGIFSESYFGHFLNRLGGWGVALFFFISGYGLFTSYDKKGREYLKHFFRNRILPFYFSYYFFVALYSAIMYKSVTLKLILSSLTFGGTIVSFGWFFQYIGIFYLIFFLSYRFTGRKAGNAIFLALMVVFTCFCYLGGFRYTEAVPFLLGMLVALNKGLIDRILKSLWWLILSASLIVIFGVYFSYIYSFIYARITFIPFVWELISTIGDIGVIVFAVSFCYATRKLPIVDNVVSRWINRYSLEIYATQGIVLYLLYPLVDKLALYVMLCFAITVAAGIIMHFVIASVTKRIKIQ